MSTRKLHRIEREGRFEAARGVLLARLEQARRDDGWFTSPGVLGRLGGRDVDVRFLGGPEARTVRLRVRIRTGDGFSARPRARMLRFFGASYLALRGAAPEGVPFAVERLLRDFGVTRVVAGEGRVEAALSWDSDAPDAERVLKVLERLGRIGGALEGESAPLVETRGTLSCPFCREEIPAEAPLARCDACGTPYHPACFEESNGCAIYGCRHRTARSTSGRLGAPSLAPQKETEDA